MTRVETLYRWLGSDVRPATNEILAAALAHAERPYAARIATILLGRRHESAWVGLVANYDRIPPELQQRVHARPELVRVGIGAAFKRGDGRGLQNALALLSDQPCPALSYLVADALRDSRPPVREAAGKTLRRCAEQVLTDADQMAEVGQGVSAPAAGERAELARALREALRTFELHRRLEVLEAGLWFAKDLGDSLWEALSGHNSRRGYLVAQHLKSWNHPRLAGFLLLALARPTWRRNAQELLSSWYQRAEVVALLRNSDLLANPDVRRSLHYLRRPRWFVAAIQALAQLPADARAQLPHWVGHLGFSDEERLQCLLRWQDSALPEVRRAATYALASLGGAQAARALARVVAQRDSVAQFARWFLAGRRGGRGRADVAQAKGKPGVARQSKGDRHRGDHMSISGLGLGLLATLDQREILDSMRQGFESRPPDMRVFGILLGVAVVCGLLGLLTLLLRRGRRLGHPRRGDYLSEAARVAGLNHQELHDLRTIAKRSRLPHPTAMLLSPANLSYATCLALSGDDDRALRQRLDRLSPKLFGSGLPAEPGDDAGPQ